MERDFHRYVVVKVAHAEQALTREELRTLYGLGQKVYNWQRKQGKPTFECLVVEHDWPEYEKVWNMIETRVDADSSGIEFNSGFRDAESHWKNTGESPLLKGVSIYCNGWNNFMRLPEEAKQ